MNIENSTEKYISKHNLFTNKDTVLVATSGGSDSVVLCTILKALGYDIALAHCNFKLRGDESDRDEIFVKQLAASFDVPFFSTSFETEEVSIIQKKSIEETARDLRYNWFYKLMKELNFSCIATAHHADDNVETVVMNFFRGTGITGLRGILPKQNKIVRPILHLRKKEILQYATDNKIAYLEDATNAENDYTRNLFRNEILPQIEKVYPEANSNILRNIDRLSDVAFFYNQNIDKIKATLIEKKGEELHIPILKLQKQNAVSTIMYEIIKDYNFTSHQTTEVIKLFESETGKFITSSTHRILKNRNWLIISPLHAESNGIFMLEKLGDEIFSPMGKMKIELASSYQPNNENKNICFINANEITFPLFVRRWRAGDYFYPLGMQKKKKLSKFFIDNKLSIADKEKMWVVESNKKIVWVIGMRIDDRFKVKPDALQKTAKVSLF